MTDQETIDTLRKELEECRAAHEATKQIVRDQHSALRCHLDTIDRLRAALAQAEADTRRLDWFEQHGELVWQRISMPGWWFWREKEQNRGSADTLRKAIDFAMK